VRGLTRGLAAAAALAVLLAACHKSEKPGPVVTPTLPGTPAVTGTGTGLPVTPLITVTASPAVSATATTASSPAPSPAHSSTPPPTPGATLQSAEAYVQAQNTLGGSLQFVNPAQTWVDGNTLHALHAQPTGAAGTGGDTFYFFVQGAPVGHTMFTQSVQDAPVDPTTFGVTYDAYRPGDASCCPSGGMATVRFHWNGSALVTVGSLAGATLS